MGEKQRLAHANASWRSINSGGLTYEELYLPCATLLQAVVWPMQETADRIFKKKKKRRRRREKEKETWCQMLHGQEWWLRCVNTSAPMLCALVETLQLSAQLPVTTSRLTQAGQLDWSGYEAQTHNSAICSVITAWEQKSHPAGHGLLCRNSWRSQWQLIVRLADLCRCHQVYPSSRGGGVGGGGL